MKENYLLFAKKCEYNEVCDKDAVEVVPRADWDISEAMYNNVLGDVGAPVKGDYNNLPVDKIIGRCQDPFVALELNKVIKGFADKRGEVKKPITDESDESAIKS